MSSPLVSDTPRASCTTRAQRTQTISTRPTEFRRIFKRIEREVMDRVKRTRQSSPLWGRTKGATAHFHSSFRAHSRRNAIADRTARPAACFSGSGRTVRFGDRHRSGCFEQPPWKAPPTSKTTPSESFRCDAPSCRLKRGAASGRGGRALPPSSRR